MQTRTQLNPISVFRPTVKTCDKLNYTLQINKKQRCDAAIGEASQATATANADCACANHAEHVEYNDKQESFTTVTEEPINVPEHNIMLEQDFVPILRDLPEEPELLPSDYDLNPN